MKNQDFNMERLRAKIVADYPLLSGYMLSLKMTMTTAVPTLAVTMDELFYNPTFIEQRSPKDQQFFFLHEYAHVFLGHPLRLRPEMNTENAQKAADYAANDLLHDSGVELPHDALYSHEFRGMGFEQIYQKLEANQERRNNQKWDKKKHGECKSEEGRAKAQAKAEGEPEPSKKQIEEKVKAAQEENKRKVNESVQNARMAGKLTGKLKRRIDKMTESKSDWRQVFPDVVEDIYGMDDYTFEHPDRRYDCDFILPGMIGHKKGVAVLVGDTSISISSSLLVKMAAEVLQLIDNAEPEHTHVLWCDTRVQSVQSFEGSNVPTLKPVGGGGTSFAPPFKWVEDNGVEPSMLVYLTDGECSRFAPEPDYPVVWIVWQDDQVFKPPYGTVVVMHDNPTNS